MSAPADWSIDVWIAVGLGSAAGGILLIGVAYALWNRYGGRASMQSSNMRSASVPRERGRDGNGFGPASLFAAAPGGCVVEGDVPAMPLLAFP
jgi:hypothetical protein